MHWNPCGAKVDIGRVPFKRLYRPFRDDPTREVSITWYPARKDAPTLPYVSALDNPVWNDNLSGIFFEDGDFVQDQPFQYSNEKVKLGATGFKPCGSRIDFEQGGLAESGLPPVIYTSSGLPRCCLPPIDGKVTGGGAPRSVVASLDVLPGEVTGGGVPSAVVVHYPPGNAAGEDCTGTTPAPLAAQQCSQMSPGGELWFAWTLGGAGGFTITLSGLTDSEVQIDGYGGTCPGGLAPYLLTHVASTLVWNGIAFGAGVIYVRITGIGSGGGEFCLTITQP